MRLGAYPAKVQKGTRLYAAYKAKMISERHRHRYEFENHYQEQFIENGVVFSGINPDNDLVEAIEVAEHPWFVGVQFHPEFKSRPTKPAPLFAAFIKACLEKK